MSFTTFTDAGALVCTHQASRPGEKLLHHQGCSRCCRDTQDMGAAAVELLRMVDVRQDRGVFFLFGIGLLAY